MSIECDSLHRVVTRHGVGTLVVTSRPILCVCQQKELERLRSALVEIRECAVTDFDDRVVGICGRALEGQDVDGPISEELERLRADLAETKSRLEAALKCVPKQPKGKAKEKK